MKTIVVQTLAAALLCAAASGASAQLYRWTDDKGRVHFTNSPPPPGAKNVQKRAAPAPAATAPDSGAEPYALQQARKEFPVALYSAPGCGPCEEARKLLNARGIPFREVGVMENPQIEELKKLFGEATVPVLTVGRTVQKGYEQSAYNALLDSAGYPKAGVLPPRKQEAPTPSRPEVLPAEAPPPAGPYSTDNLR
jgi:glutaredoxin